MSKQNSKNLKDFFGQSQKRIQKGEYAEELVRKELETKKWQVYQPPAKQYSHIFDFVCLKWDCSTLFVEVKASRMQGEIMVKTKNIASYKKIIERYKQDFLLFVVNNSCTHSGIYCTQFRGLLKPIRIDGRKYPICKDAGQYIKHATYRFSLDQFKKVRDLTKTELQKLNKLSGG